MSPWCKTSCRDRGCGKVRVASGIGVVLAAIEGTGFDVGQRVALEDVSASLFEIAKTVARHAKGDDVALAIAEHA